MNTVWGREPRLEKWCCHFLACVLQKRMLDLEVTSSTTVSSRLSWDHHGILYSSSLLFSFIKC